MVDAPPNARNTLNGAEGYVSPTIEPTSAGFFPLAGGLSASSGATKPLNRTVWGLSASRVPRYLPILFILIALILAACASDSADPARAVEQYIQAKVAGDRPALQRLLCSSMEADLDREALSFNGVDARVENMSCARDGQGNTVTCSGAIVATYSGEDREFPLGVYNVVQEDGEWKWCGEAG